MESIFEKIGNRVFAVPVVFCLLIALVFGTAMFPMLQMSPHNIKFAIVSLDEGATTFAGDTNIGDTMIDKVTSGETSFFGSSSSDETTTSSTISSDAIEWVVMDSEQEVLDAMNAGESLYGAVIIPKTFTADQMMSTLGISNAAEVKVLLNYGKNPSTATNLQSTMQNMMLKNGITVDVEMINQKDIGGGTMSGMMGIQFMVMPLVIMCIIPALLFFLIKGPKAGDDRKQRTRASIMQIVFSLFASLIAACFAVCIVTFGGGMSVPVLPCILLLWLGAFSMMMFLQGLNNIALPLGVLGGLCLFCLGLGCTMFGQEMLPAFWADWVYPWAPQAALGEGLRQICYMGWDVTQVNVGRLLVLIAIGLIAMIIALFLPDRKKPEPGSTNPLAAKIAARKAARSKE